MIPSTFALLASMAQLEVNPDLHVAHLGRIAWISARTGDAEGGMQGIYAYETRLLSRYRWLVDGEPLQTVTYTTVEPGRAMRYAVTLPPDGEDEEKVEGCGERGVPRSLNEQCVALQLDRTLDAVVGERVVLTNYTPRKRRLTLALELEADFSDYEDAARGERRHRGGCTQRWFTVEADGNGADRGLQFVYRASHRYDQQGHKGRAQVERSLKARFLGFSSPPRYDEKRGRVCFDVELEPQESWSGRVEIEPGPEGRLHPEADAAERACAPRRVRLYDSLAKMTGFAAGASEDLTPVVLRALERARADLAEMRLYELDGLLEEGEWTLVAGVPLYLSLFGRDPMTAAWQGAMVDRGMLPGTLHELARWQGTVQDDWRNEQPGRMLHEAHTSPANELRFNPRGRDYSSITASAFYPVVLSEAWHWYGDEAMARRYVEPALRALQSRETYARGDDGFYYYNPRSQQSREHQGWKDSEAGIVDEHGRVLEPHLATSEEQGFTYWAKLVMAEMLWWLGEASLARRLYQEARELKLRFNERFWMPEENFYAMAMRPDGTQVRSIGSNIGHCLATGIVDDARVEAVAERLVADDLFSGWGVRTLSTGNPAYNPFSYHRGTVWPVENATFALGFTRYGLHGHTQLLARAMFEASTLFAGGQLPEVFGGQPRDAEHPVPGLYPQANSPQAWSASAVVLFVQAMLGLYPYAPLKILMVDPQLPEWLPKLRLDGLRVGDARVSLSFERKPSGRTSYRVEDLQGTLHVVRQPSPWSLTAGPLERTRDALESLLPRH